MADPDDVSLVGRAGHLVDDRTFDLRRGTGAVAARGPDRDPAAPLDGLGQPGRDPPEVFDQQHDPAGIIDPDRALSEIAASPLPEVDLVLELSHPPEAARSAIERDWAESIARWQRALGQWRLR